jgi:acetolactate synthase-1/2/3 large subunit
MMAAATADLTDGLGVALTTKGPGVANAANGVACAALDRSAVMLVTDGFTEQETRYVTHQVFDQKQMLAPVVKMSSRLESDDIAGEIRDLVALAKSPPYGPVHVEISGAGSRAISVPDEATCEPDRIPANAPANTDAVALRNARQLIANASRPVIVAGLEARSDSAKVAARALAETLGCPLLTTYKAKGVFDESHDQYAGMFTSGKAESACVEKADLIVLCGLDPVELLRIPWRYKSPVVDVALVRHDIHYVEPDAGLYGPLAGNLTHLAEVAPKSDWSRDEIRQLRESMQARLEYPACDGLGPQQIVEIAAAKAGDLEVMPRITVDAGAHMFSAMAFWPGSAPHDAMISNGLATMAYAVPAAIAAALHEPQRTTIAFTGDGGLLMCLGELSVAVEQSARIIVIVFNDQSLSLIDIKQQQRKLPSQGVRWQAPDFARIMEGMGGLGIRAENENEYRAAIEQALGHDGPTLIDARVDPQGYLAQMKSLRG